ncbi:AP-4 complex subunit beta-1 [Amphibalanus amphitrite]|uniref:AP-4 complex subunit beta-1 n=1 Tax=Amphibalanus amphitrite TaxID=1232801 RepID=A0A6A4VDA6_AMPAM|nr:AP-4 complex subunit beta-1 [Amphibalanus amphitrite]KAF0288351.1 AP-4 complex subunit beta-1 [Amphibalanus amphitrite]KAF0288352.1 AP-4 complex subunit beta-1 [Amphibalanus amphitrite]
MGDNQQLLNLLSLPNVLLDPSKQQQAVTQLCQLMNTDSDEPRIVQPSIKLLSSHQPLTRIVVMTLVQRHVGRNPDIMPQATNALLKCAVDPNPAVRRAAVSTLARMPDSGDITQPVIAAALRDPHPSVQRAAAVACRVFPRTSQSCHIDHIDELYRLIRSDDALLVHACLMTLDVILAAEGGVVINRAMVRHLTSRSRSLPDAVLVDVLRLLCRYQPASDEERLAVMNRLDWVLASPRPHLIEAALELFFHLCSGDLSHLRADAVLHTTSVRRRDALSSDDTIPLASDCPVYCLRYHCCRCCLGFYCLPGLQGFSSIQRRRARRYRGSCRGT